jgi:hypothetical protein
MVCPFRARQASGETKLQRPPPEHRRVITIGSLGLPRRLLGQARSGVWLTRERVRAYAAILLVLELAGLVFCVAGTHGLIVPLNGPISTDFVSFYAAGLLTDAGTPALVYDQAMHYAAEQAAREPGIAYNYFYYPPVFLLLCGALARLPYMVAFIGFQLATLVPCVLVGRRILAEKGWEALLPLLAFPAVVYTVGTGQNAFLSAALFGGATLLVDRRPILAGLLFGALCYKPHFGLLVPVALLAAGRWRVFAAAAVTVAALVGASVLAFGWETWSAFLTAAAGSHATYEAHISHSGMASPFGAVLVMGGSPTLAYGVQAMATVVAVVVVWWAWRGDLSLPYRAAVLAAATPIAVPVVLFYDLMLSGVALAWLVRAGREHGFPAWGRTATAVLFIMALLTANVHPDSHRLVTSLTADGVLILALVCAARERAASAVTVTRDVRQVMDGVVTARV